jgi:signal transduction histidine kinase
LSSIIGYAEFLEDELSGPLADTQHAYVREIQEGARRLQRIVDDLLDFARMEAGTFRLMPREADLVDLVEEVLRSLRPQALQGNLHVAQTLPQSRINLWMDPDRIGQVLLNLVGNAIKFTPPDGNVTVNVTRLVDKVYVEVKDDGIGIAPENVANLFDKFYQVDPSLTRVHGGAGLGLAISRVLIESHSGSIGVTSELGKGSTFWFTLPLKSR